MPPEVVRGPHDITPVPQQHDRRMSTADGDDEQWNALLRWLRDKHGMDISPSGLLVERRDAKVAGKGLFALQSCPRSATLFTISASAMINLKTLSPLYPAAGKLLLTANQMITLHLMLHRPGDDGLSHDPAWGPYITTMPREFDSHPVTWAVRSQVRLATTLEQELLSLLPSRIVSVLNERVRLFLADWTAICKYSIAAPGIIARTSRHGLVSSAFHPDNHSLIEDCLWAWLNVNTRCIYYQLDPSPSAPENLTLCPVLDFANHRPNDTHIVPVLPSSLFPPSPGSFSKGRRNLGGDYMFISSSETPVNKDDELFLRYGSHSNRMLFVEYGFVNTWSKGACASGEFNGDVDLQDVVEEVLISKGAVGRLLREVLEEEGYWGYSYLFMYILRRPANIFSWPPRNRDWTMHSQPKPAHPSYRLISALRLLHAIGNDMEEDKIDSVVERWRAVLWGQEEQISAKNEKAWRSTLIRICDQVAKTAKTGIESVQGRSKQAEDPGWTGWVLGNIEMLWREECEVAEAVRRSVEAGTDF